MKKVTSPTVSYRIDPMVTFPAKWIILASAFKSDAALPQQCGSANLLLLALQLWHPALVQEFGEAMAMNPSGAYGMYAHDAELEPVMLTLNRSGFQKEDICLMVSPSHPFAKVVRQGQVLNSDGEGGAAAGLMRWLFEFGAVMIPTVGFFIRSQMFLRALVTGKDSGGLCGNSRALVGLGFSEYDAERFGSQLRDVGVLVYVACPRKSNAAWAVEVLRKTGAQEPALLGQNTSMTAAAAV